MNHYISNAINSLIRVTDLQALVNEEEHDSIAQLLIEFSEPSHLGLFNVSVPDSYYHEQAESMLSDELFKRSSASSWITPQLRDP